MNEVRELKLDYPDAFARTVPIPDDIVFGEEEVGWKEEPRQYWIQIAVTVTFAELDLLRPWPTCRCLQPGGLQLPKTHELAQRMAAQKQDYHVGLYLDDKPGGLLRLYTHISARSKQTKPHIDHVRELMEWAKKEAAEHLRGIFERARERQFKERVDTAAHHFNGEVLKRVNDEMQYCTKVAKLKLELEALSDARAAAVKAEFERADKKAEITKDLFETGWPELDVDAVIAKAVSITVGGRNPLVL